VTREYENPPLAEALCEFRFSSGPEWRREVCDRFYDRIKGSFPGRSEKPEVQVVSPAEIEAPARLATVQFTSQDTRSVIQIRPDSLILNQLTPYPGWPEYRTIILTQLDHYLAVFQPPGLESVTLRYLNRVSVPQTEIDLTMYFNALPGLPQGLPGIVTAFLTTSNLAYVDPPPMSLRLVFGSAQGPDTTRAHFLMDMDISSVGEVSSERAAIEEWLGVGHDRIEVAFDSSFTELAHQDLFKEVLSHGT
jgi:uncharacterized protein (TIGR04255 family)